MSASKRPATTIANLESIVEQIRDLQGLCRVKASDFDEEDEMQYLLSDIAWHLGEIRHSLNTDPGAA